MQEDKRPIDTLLRLAKMDGYTGDAEHLSGLVSNNPEAAEFMLGLAKKDGYTGDMEHFVATFGVQEGNVEATADGGEESQASSGAEQTTEEFVMPEIQQATQESVYDAIQESQKAERRKITGAVESQLTEQAEATRSEEMGKRIKDNVLSITPENVEDFYKTFGIEKEKKDHNGIMRVDMPWEIIGDMEPDEQSAMLQQLALYNNPELLKKYNELSNAKREEYNYEKYGARKPVTKEELMASIETYDVGDAHEAGEVSKMDLEEKMAYFDKRKAEVLNEAMKELQKDSNKETVNTLIADLEGRGVDISQLSEDEAKNLEARLNIATNGAFNLNEDDDVERREDATVAGDMLRGFGSEALNIYAGIQQSVADVTGSTMLGLYAHQSAQMADDFRGDMTEYLTSLSDDVSNMDIGRVAERTAVMLGESAPLMIVAAAAGAVTGGTGAGAVTAMAVEFGATAGVSMLGTYGDVSNEEWFNELSGAEKLGYVAETGIAEGLPAVVGARIFKHAFKAAAPSYSAFAANRSAQNLGAFLKGATKSTFLGMLEEGTTEGLTGVWQASADSRYKRAAIENQLKDPNLSTEERNQLQAEYESLEFTMEGAKEAFIEGGLGGVLLGGGLSTAGTVGRSVLTEVAFMSNPDLKAILKLSGEAKKNAARVLGGMDSETRAARAKVGQTLQLIQEAEGRGDVEAAKQLQQQMAEDMKAFNATRAAREEFYSGLDEDKRMDLATLYAKLEAGARALKSKNTPDSGKAAIRQQIAETVKTINDLRAENDMDVDGRSSVDFVRDINMNIDAVALYGNIAPESGNVDLEGDIETELLQAAEGVLGRGKLDQDARDSIQALADVAGMKGGPVRLHYTRESYGKDVGVANAASTNGFFRTEDGTVHIFAPTMTRSTAYHETIHRIAGEDLESGEAGKALGAMLDSMPEGVASVIKRLAAANMRAKGVSFDGQLPSVEEIMADSDVVDEVLTEFLAQVSSGQVNVEYRRGFRQGVIKMIDGLTGGKLTPVNRRRIQHMRINQAVDAFNMVRDAFRDSDTEGVKAGIQQLANIKGEAAPVTDTAADTTTDTTTETTTDTEATADATTDTTTEAAPEVDTAEDTTTETAPDVAAARLQREARLQRIEARRKLVRAAVNGIRPLSSKAALRWDGSKFLLSDTVETTAENQATVDALNELFAEAFAKEGVLPRVGELRYHVKANQSAAEARAEHQAFTDKVVSKMMNALLTGDYAGFAEAAQEGNGRNEAAIRDNDAWVGRNQGKGAKFSADEKGAQIAVYESGSVSVAPFVGMGDVGYKVNGKLFRGEHYTLRSLIKDIDSRKTEGMDIGEVAAEVLSGAFVNAYTGKPAGKPQLESMDVDSIDNQNEQEAGSMFMGEVDMRRGKPQLAMGDLDYAIQPSYDPDTYLESYSEDDLPEELRLSMPDPVELEAVLNKSKGAAVFINSDGTKVGVVRGQNIKGGYRYVFLNESQEAKAGFASTSKTHVGVMHGLVQQLDDARKPEDKGAPVAVFVTIQAAETMTGEWYSAKYVADGIAEVLEKGMLTEEQVLDALVDAYVLGEADTAAKRPAKKAKVLAADVDVYNAEVEKAKEKARKELAKDGITEPTEEQIEDTYPMHMSKDAQVGFIVGEIAKGSMDSERVQELFTSKMTFGGRVSLIGNTLAYIETNNPLSNALLELGYTKMEFFREYMDEAPLAMFEKALAADKKKDSKAKYERAAGAITGMVMGGFYADPSLDPNVAKENAKGRVEHQQFDTAFTSNGEVFRLNKPYNVDTLQFRIGAPTKQGVSFYNEHAGGDKYYKGTDKKDIMASVAPSDVSKVESLVEGGMSVRQAVQSIGYVEYGRVHRQGVSDFIMEAAVGSAAPETKSRYGEFVVAQKGDDVRAMAKLMTSPYGNVAISAYPSGIIKLQSDMVERLSSESKAVGESIIEAYNSMDKGEQTAAFEAMFKSQEKMIPFSGQGLVEASQKGEAVQQLREKLEAAPEGKKQVGDVDMLGDLVESMYNGWTASEARTMLKEFGFSKTQVDELMRLAQQRLRGRREGIREEYRSRIEERKEARKNSTLATNLQAKLDAERLAGKTRKEATSIIIKLISEVLKEQGIKGLKPQHILQMMTMVAKPTRAAKNKLNGDEAADFQEKIIERIMQLETELAKGRQAAEVLAQFKKDVAKARELQRKVRRMQKKKHKDGGIHLAYKQGAMMLTSVNAAHLSPAQAAELVTTLNSLISTQKTGVVKGEVRDRSSVEAINAAAKNFQAQNVQFNTMADLRRAERMAKRENAKRKQQGRAQVTVQEMMDKLYADRHMAEIKRARTTLERLADERGVDISTPEALAKFEEEVMEELFAKNQERIEALAGSVRNLAAAAQYQVGNNANLKKIYGKDIEARIAELEAAGDYATLAKLELALYNAAVNNSFADTTKLASDLHIRFEKLPKLRALIKSGKIKVRKRGSLARRGSTLDTIDSALSLIVMTDKKTVAKVREALGLTSLENGYALADSAFTGIIDGEYGNGAFPGLIGLLKKAGVDMKAMTKAPFAAGLQVLSTLEQMPEGANSTEWAQDVYNAAVASIEYAAKQDKYSTKEIQEMRENVLEVYEEGMTMEEYSEALVQKHPQSREIITAYRTVHQHARAKWGYDQFYSDALGIDPEMGENYTPFSFRKVGEDADKSFTNLVQDRMTGANTGTGAEHRTSSSRDRKAKAIKSVNGKKFVMDLDFHNINTQVLRDNASSIFAADALYEARTIMNNEGTIDGILDMHGDDVKMMQQFITQYADADHAGGNVVFTKEGTVFGIKVANPLYYAKKAAVINAFGSLFGAQIIKQSSVAVSVLAQTRHASSKAEFVEYVSLMAAMGVKRGSMNMNRIMPDAMKRMLMENSPVFQRDYESALIDSETSGHVSFDENYFDIVSDKLGNISLGMLKGTDKVMAAASWFAFYSDYVRSEEGREVNWEEESKNPNADAVGHANRMVSKDQAASTARQSAQLYSTKSGIAKYFLDTVMPFSRFGVNKKRSVLADIVKLAQAPTAEAKREAATALAGHFAEMYAFAAVGAYVIPATAAAVLGDEDEVPEFFSTKQQLTIVSRAMKDILLPLNLESTDAAAVTLMNKAYYGAFVADEYTEGMTDAQAEKAYEDWLRRNGASVFVSKDDAMSLKGLSGMLGPAGAWMYNSGVAVANLNYTLEGSGKYMKPNGDVVYIDPDFQDRAAFTSMMQFGMTLGQFAGISAQEVGKLTRMYDDAHVATAIKEESAYLFRMQREGLLGDVRYREVLDNAGLLDNIDETDVAKIKKNAKAVAKDKKFRERIIAEFGEDFYMDHAEELVYDTYLGVAGIAEILREEDEEYVRALRIVLGNSSKLKQAIAINRKRNG